MKFDPITRRYDPLWRVRARMQGRRTARYVERLWAALEGDGSGTALPPIVGVDGGGLDGRLAVGLLSVAVRRLEDVPLLPASEPWTPEPGGMLCPPQSFLIEQEHQGQWVTVSG